MQQTVAIRSRAVFAGIVREIQAAIGSNVLRVSDSEPAQAMFTQDPYGEFHPDGPWPDHVWCHFECVACGQPFELSVETYHGSGGRWGPVGKPAGR